MQSVVACVECIVASDWPTAYPAAFRTSGWVA